MIERLERNLRLKHLLWRVRDWQELDVRPAHDFNLCRLLRRQGRNDHGVVHKIGFRLTDAGKLRYLVS